MQRVAWTQLAVADLAGIRDYIEQFNPDAAARTALRLVSAADSLAEFAERGRPSALGRELVAVWPYIIRYRVEPDRILILRIRHGARQNSHR